VLLISPSVYSGLSEEDKQVFATAARNAMARNRKEVDAVLTSGLETLKSQGMTVVADVDKAAFRAKLDDIYAEFAKRFGEDKLKAIEETR
jgi:TRAP-type C4-dicarboxylate transport system substrate-binding protein